EDEWLAARSQGGDLAAFDVLARRYEDRLFSYARRLVGEAQTAADLAQETLLRAFRSLGRFDTDQRFGPWVFGIAAHVCRDWLRRRGRRPEQRWEEMDLAAPTPTPAAQAAQAEERERVVRAVELLPPKYREVVVLHYLEEMPYDEVARSLDITPAAARRRALRARAMLRKRLARDED
ncbi:MAG: RNA polymerase sigma factor, partial [bacterium]